MTRIVQTDLINALNREPWTERALCANDPLPDDWFGGVATPSESSGAAARRDQEARRRARAVCAVCPVASECYAAAVERDERHGIYGGVAFDGVNGRAERDRRRAAFVKRNDKAHQQAEGKRAWAEIVAAS